MTGMRARGYDAHGFDVSMASAGPQVIVAAKFEASLFGSRKFGCVMLREVIEHVEDWKGLLAEAARAVCRGGLLQVQTPLPAPCLDRICYQDSHLFLVPHVALVEVLRALDLRVCHAGMWPHGQVITCRREVNTR
jgi:2-polyprenyl-3-methyl-5-hydroxy-6-metoxy-1,4-benzoquinol methylase